ncbi:MAG: hypothetical protein ACE5H1_03015, partial [Thermodesulfobacteriota bacterium]
MTREFWKELERHSRLCSYLTLEELRQAPPELAQKLIALTTDFEIIPIDDQMKALAQVYVQEGVVSPKYLADALHIAAVVHGDEDILVSWNFKRSVRRRTRLLINYINFN